MSVLFTAVPPFVIDVIVIRRVRERESVFTAKHIRRGSNSHRIRDVGSVMIVHCLFEIITVVNPKDRLLIRNGTILY